jgi:hypothetical protein
MLTCDRHSVITISLPLRPNAGNLELKDLVLKKGIKKLLKEKVIYDILKGIHA